MFAAAFLGAIAGGTSVMYEGGVAKIASAAGDMIAQHLLQVYIVLILISVAIGEVIMEKLRELSGRLSESDDEESDILEYKMEKCGAAGVVSSNLFLILSMILIALFAGMDNFAQDETFVYAGISIAACLILCIYNGIWQIRYVKNMQKVYPEKKGDPTSVKFQDQWLESCDEAEKETIYQSAYSAYKSISMAAPAVACAAALAHMVWNTGIMAVLASGLIWMVAVVSYSRSCVLRLKKKAAR